MIQQLPTLMATICLTLLLIAPPCVLADSQQQAIRFQLSESSDTSIPAGTDDQPIPEADAPLEPGENIFSVLLRTVGNFIVYFIETLPNVTVNSETNGNLSPQASASPGLGPFGLAAEMIGSIPGINLPDFLIPLFLNGEYVALPADENNATEQPQVPAINRTVVGITENGGFTKPHIPPFRWSADGRLGVNSQVGGFPDNPSDVQLYLLAPEKLEETFIDGPPGPTALVLDVEALPFKKLSPERGVLIQHTNICDPLIRDPGERHNPYACGADNKDDCYDFSLVSALTEEGSDPFKNGSLPAFLSNWDRLIRTPLHIRVENPKTKDARIAEVSYGEPSYSPKRTGVLFETLTPADGRLFVARRNFMPLLWQNTANGDAQIGSYDVVYGISPPDAEPCDVSYWSDLYPITHAPYDSRVNSRYLFAQQPFRDPTGELIADGADIKGTYPWMDKEAKMFSFQASGARLFPSYAYNQDPLTRYPTRCVVEEGCDAETLKDTDQSKDNMFVIVGGWTQGKMVLLDGLLNDIDYKMGLFDTEQAWLSLYQPGTGTQGDESGEVRIGATRISTSFPFRVPVRNANDELIGHFNPKNASMFDSIENRLNYLPNLKTVKPLDVVWNISSGHSTVEFGFDDYLNPDSFIVSNMVGLMQWHNNNWYRMTYFDGWQQGKLDFVGEVRIQNSATAKTDRWEIPKYGRLRNGRLEPVANGGIRGKGIWFNGESTRLDYEIPTQPQTVAEKYWFYSLFIDPRDVHVHEEQTLIHFPDNSRLSLQGLTELHYIDTKGESLVSIDVSDFFREKSWTHLALLISPNTSNIELFTNGFPLHQWHNANGEQLFSITDGTLSLGGSKLEQPHFHGWLDEFKVFAYEPNLESICNFAHGTLVGLGESYSSSASDRADLYPQDQHDRISHQLALYGQPTHPRYACHYDYSNDDLAHMGNIPEGTAALRESFNFPEGPLYHDAPRPDSSTNEFCLSCHHTDGAGGLDLEALALNTELTTKQDRRRQPLQPPARVHGNIPENWLAGSPPSAQTLDQDGQLIDEWILPSKDGVGAEILNLVLADDHGEAIELLENEATVRLDELASEITTVKANVNGLARSVEFVINGETWMDEQVPFTLTFEEIQLGENRITARALLADGSASESIQVNISIK